MKIVTLNCANYDDHPDWIVRKSMIVDQIAKLKPDILCLQEIRFDPSQKPTDIDYLNMGEQITYDLISRGLSFENFFSNAQYYDPSTYDPISNPTSVYEGLSILAIDNKKNKERKISTLHLPLETQKDLNKRITQHIQWYDDDIEKTINIFNVHFSFDEEQLMSDIDNTLKYCENFKRNIIVGDMNSDYDKIKKPFERANYFDLWTLINPDEPGYTFPSGALIKRIDYCWISIDLLHRYNTIQISTILSTPNKDGIYASDHLGLFIEL